MSYEVRDFATQVLERSREIPVLVDFWAPWCGPCKQLGPLLEKLAAEASGRWELVKVNTEEHADLATRYEIASIPAVKLFRGGEVLDEFVGFLPEIQIRAWLDTHLGPSGPSDLEAAAELIDNGDLPTARTRLEKILAESPTRQAARLLLAETLLASDPARAVQLLEEVPDDADEAGHAQALLILARAGSRPASDFPEDRVRDSLLAGLAAIRERNWDAALEAFIDVTERRPKYAGGLAAEAGKAIFRYLGIRHPIAERHYRRFSSAINS